MTDHHNEAKTIGTALSRTDSRPLYVKPGQTYPAAPATQDEARQLQAWAERQPQRWEPADPSVIVKALEFMAALLPSRNLDAEAGRHRVAGYVKLLGDYSAAAIAYLSRRACSEEEWFPTPAKCLQILSDFRDPPTPREHALALCHGFAQRRFEDFRAALKAGEGTDELIAAVPDQWKRICVEQGFLRWTKEGGFVIEDRYRRLPA